MRIVPIALLAAGCSGGDKTETPAAGGQTAAEVAAPAPAAPPRELGVLGIRNGAGQIKTILVDEKGFKTLSSGLVVPRESGWWWLGYIGQGGWDQLVLWSAPSGSTPEAPPIDLKGAGDVSLQTLVHYVGRDYVSFEYHASGMSPGAAHPWQRHELVTTKLEAPLKVNEDGTFTVVGDAVELSELAGEEGGKALLAAGASAKAAGECLGEPSAAQWGLFRDRGAWAVRGGLSYESEACRDRYAHYPVDIDVPAALLDGYPPLDPPFETWVEAVPGLVDVTASPSGNLAVLFTGDGVKLKIGDNYDAKQLYTKQPELVMAFWVTGDQVDAWREAASAASPTGGRRRDGRGGFSVPGRTGSYDPAAAEAAAKAAKASADSESAGSKSAGADAKTTREQEP